MRISSTGPTFPKSPEDRRHIQHILAAQLFSFIRDIGHHHKHHSPKTDTIVDLYEIEGGDDRNWRLGTLYSIYRRIITNKRRRNIQAQISNIGLLAYAKAFKRTWTEKINDPDIEKKIIPAFYDDALKESIQASEVEMRFKLQIRQERGSTYRTLVFAFFSFIFSLAGLAKIDPTIKVHAARVLYDIANGIAMYPMHILIGIPILVSIGITVTRGYFTPEVSPPFRFLQAYTATLSKGAAVSVWLSAAAVVAAITIFVTFKAAYFLSVIG